MVVSKQHTRLKTGAEQAHQYSAAQTAKIFGISKRTLLKWEEQKFIPQPQRVTRGKLEYRAYSKRDIEQIGFFIESRRPNSHIQIVGKDPDGLPRFGRKLRGPSIANVQALRGTDEALSPYETYSSLNEALGAACAAALKMRAKTITISDGYGHTKTITVLDKSEELDSTETPRTISNGENE